MQVVKVEFVVHCEDMSSLNKTSAEQKAVSFIEYILTAGIACPSKYLESWNVIQVSDRAKGYEYQPVEDGKVQNV